MKANSNSPCLNNVSLNADAFDFYDLFILFFSMSDVYEIYF